MIIGVDRLDYSKGIALRMEAFDIFLLTHPEWRGRVTYLQITPKSRSEIREYADMERQIDETAGRVNGKYGEASWTPIRDANRSHSRSALAGLYRSAKAALVTPLRDGMNLVAKEYVASQDFEVPGVLILSRFAGAAVECEAALLVNPYDTELVGSAIGQASLTGSPQRVPQLPRRAVPSAEGKRCRIMGRAVSDRSNPTAEPPKLARTNGPFQIHGATVRENSRSS